MLVVPDTNILLHYQLLTDIDFKRHVSPQVTSIVVPLVVIDELDDKKFSSSKAIASRAATVLRVLEKCAAGEVALKNDVTLEVLGEDDGRMRRSRPDDEIVRVCNDLLELRGQPIGLLTSDYGMRLRARSRFSTSSNVVYALPEELLLRRSNEERIQDVALADQAPAPKANTKSNPLHLTLDGQARFQPQPIPRLRKFDEVVEHLIGRERDTVSPQNREYHQEFREWAHQAVWRRIQERLAIALPLKVLNQADDPIETIAVKLTLESKEDDLVFVLSDDISEDNEPDRPRRPTNSMYDFMNYSAYVPPVFNSDWEIERGEKLAVATVDRIWPDGRDHTWSDGISVVARDASSFTRGFAITWELYATSPKLSLKGKLHVLPREILEPTPPA